MFWKKNEFETDDEYVNYLRTNLECIHDTFPWKNIGSIPNIKGAIIMLMQDNETTVSVNVHCLAA